MSWSSLKTCGRIRQSAPVWSEASCIYTDGATKIETGEVFAYDVAKAQFVKLAECTFVNA